MKDKATSNLFRWAADEGLSDSELARGLNVSAQTIYNWRNRRLPPDEYERVAKHLRRSVDELVGSTRSIDAQESSAEYMGAAPHQHLFPVAGLAQLGENGWYEEINALGAEGYVEANSLDPDAYILRVKGDSMHPAIRNGWYVMVEPSRQPQSGLYVAVRLKDGRRMVKEFLFQTSESVSLESVNGGTRLTIALADIQTMHPVTDLIMPNKHREG